MRTRAENLAIIERFTGQDDAVDEAVNQAAYEALGVDTLSDAAIALIADEYARRSRATPDLSTLPGFRQIARH